MDDTSKWLNQTKSDARIFSEAYNYRLSGLSWLNMIFLVLPADLSTAAAIFGTLPPGTGFTVMAIPGHAAMAGAAAILLAIHKAVKCDEYQAECIRLCQCYQSLSISADSALCGPEVKRESHQERLTEEWKALAAGAQALLPARYIKKAEAIVGSKLYELPAS